MVFDDTTHRYENVDNASLLATADRYRPPEVVRRIATSDGDRRWSASARACPSRPARPVDPDPARPTA